MSEINDIFIETVRCLICYSTNFKKLFDIDYTTTLSFKLSNTYCNNPKFIPFNVLQCLDCNTFQLKYLGNRNIIYSDNHADNFGITKTEITYKFSNFINNNCEDIDGIIEIGSCNDVLARSILELINTKYSIIEYDYTGNNKDLNVINGFIEDIDINTIYGNTIIMSSIFEHFYDPPSILKKIYNNKNIKYIYFNHPNYDYFSRNDTHNILNFEHIYYIENNFLIKLLMNYQFKCDKIEKYNNHSLFIKFTRDDNLNYSNQILFINEVAPNDIIGYYNRLHSTISKLNILLNSGSHNFYIWPSSAHVVTMFVHGLNYFKLKGILDNSPNKINKYLYGYNIKCYDFKQIFNTNDETNCIIIGGCGNYINELELKDCKTKIIYLKDL